MAYVMTAKQFADKAKEIATKYKTTYMWGAIGMPVTKRTIDTLKSQYPSWYTPAKVAKFNSLVGKGYWGFDCVCTLKAILWGWCADASKNYGGMKYLSNGVPDLNAGGFFSKCTGITADFSNIVVGEAVWMQGHIGIYIGNGLAVETTTRWTSECMITAVGNIGSVKGYNTRTWTKHGKLPWVDYSAVTPAAKPVQPVKPAISGITYTVKAGDTLSSICSKYGVDWRKVAKDNNITNPSIIHVGQKIVIKGAKADVTYTVKAGDTLSKICTKYGADWRSVAKYNKIANPSNIRVGQKIVIPSSLMK